MKDNQIKVPIGKKLLFFSERAAENKDKESLKAIDDIAHELLMTFDVITSDNIEFLDVREYAGMMLEALDKGTPVEEVRNSSYGKDLARLKEL